MDVRFATNQLRRQYERESLATRRYGKQVGRRYVQRVNALYDATEWAAIRSIQSFRAHPLTQNRAGQWALVLTGQWRLIVTLSNNEEAVTVEEVSNHYDD
jgi:plasmid maintenance system killer protein